MKGVFIMSQKKEAKPVTKISFNMPDDVLERIDRLAEKSQVDRTRLIINILDESTKTLEFTGKVGILQVGLLIRDMNQYIQETWGKKVKSKRIDIR